MSESQHPFTVDTYADYVEGICSVCGQPRNYGKGVHESRRTVVPALPAPANTVIVNVQCIPSDGSKSMTIKLGITQDDANEVVGNFTYAPIYKYLSYAFGEKHAIVVVSVALDTEDQLRTNLLIAHDNFARFMSGEMMQYAKR